MHVKAEFVYPRKLVVAYDGDAGYRAALRALTGSGSAAPPADPDIDAVSRDELDYDAAAAAAFMDSVFAVTRLDARLARLYAAAAGAMLSEDPEIGLAVLLAYDNLATFHACLAQYFDPAGPPLPDNEFYAALERKMRPR